MGVGEGEEYPAECRRGGEDSQIYDRVVLTEGPYASGRQVVESGQGVVVHPHTL